MNELPGLLRASLEQRDVDGFLSLVLKHSHTLRSAPDWTRLTQRIFPAVFYQLMAVGNVSDGALLKLWRCVRGGHLLVVEEGVLRLVNSRLDAALKALEQRSARAEDYLPVPTPTEEAGTAAVRRAPAQPERRNGLGSRLQDQVMRRVVLASSFLVGSPSMTDTYSFKKSVCASPQERQFLRAVRQFFPNLHAYPNVALSVFIDLDEMPAQTSQAHLKYARLSRVDVLLCTPDEDPVGGVELDSSYHDTDEAMARDAMKDELFRMAGIPLVRIRADEPGIVRAEDFYDLLVAQKALFDEMRPRRYRPRREHERLVPDELRSRVRAA